MVHLLRNIDQLEKERKERTNSGIKKPPGWVQRCSFTKAGQSNGINKMYKIAHTQGG